MSNMIEILLGSLEREDKIKKLYESHASTYLSPLQQQASELKDRYSDLFLLVDSMADKLSKSMLDDLADFNAEIQNVPVSIVQYALELIKARLTIHILCSLELAEDWAQKMEQHKKEEALKQAKEQAEKVAGLEKRIEEEK